MFNEELSWFKQESNFCQQLVGGVSSLVRRYVMALGLWPQNNQCDLCLKIWPGCIDSALQRN